MADRQTNWLYLAPKRSSCGLGEGQLWEAAGFLLGKAVSRRQPSRHPPRIANFQGLDPWPSLGGLHSSRLLRELQPPAAGAATPPSDKSHPPKNDRRPRLSCSELPDSPHLLQAPSQAPCQAGFSRSSALVLTNIVLLTGAFSQKLVTNATRGLG